MQDIIRRLLEAGGSKRPTAARRRMDMLPALLMAALLFAAPAGAQAAGPGLEELMTRIGYSKEDHKALLAGEIVSAGAENTREDQLVAAVAMLVDAPFDELTANAGQGNNIKNDPGILAFGVWPADASDKIPPEIAFDASESDEVGKLLMATDDGTFNLSAEELAMLKEALGKVDAGSGEAAKQVSEAYRRVLAGRHRAYAAKGLAGIAPYARSGGDLSPADELNSALEQATPFLEQYYPGFLAALRDYPKGQSPRIEDAIYWTKREVEGRPAFVLVHQQIEVGEDHALLSSRQFFVGHTYESLQAIALAQPVENKTAIVYVNSAYTEKVAGFLGGVARSVGQDRSRGDLERYFEALRKSLN